MSSWWSFGTANKEQHSPPPTNYASPTQPFKTMSNAFRRGVQYNMKVVIRGDVMTGKTTLFDRLQGSKFEEQAYSSTPQIQVANIPWQYKDSNDIVKIELWDVVDNAHNNSNRKESVIKLEHTTKPTTDRGQTEMVLDASTVDVYRNAHAALFIFDTTKQWTFDYVNNALASVPDNVAVLVLGNFTDKARVVSVEEIHATLYEHNQQRIENGTIKPNLIRYVDISLKTGLGLKFIYDYLGVPFLQLMMETLRKQLELKATDILDLLETLDKGQEVPEYMQRRRGQDNFDQPSEPHLARQNQEMKMAWNDDLEESSDLGSDLAMFTHSPPIAPVTAQNRQGSLDTIPSPFEAGPLEDDWFEDAEPVLPMNQKNSSDNDDDGEGYDDVPGNPMVARDEDVAAVEYYQESSPHHRRPSHEPTIIKIPDDPSHYYDEIDSKATNHYMYQPTTFKSELTHIWAAGGINSIQSESEDEDNMIGYTVNSSPSSDFQQQQHATLTDFDADGYEEISGASHDNPWYQPVYDDIQQPGDSSKSNRKRQEMQRNLSNHSDPTSVKEENTDMLATTDKKQKKKKNKSKSVKMKDKSKTVKT